MHGRQDIRQRVTGAVLCLVGLAMPSTSHSALCGDTSGDGLFAASDALATLRLAVTSGYDRRGDVVPIPTQAEPDAGDGSMTAGDALAVLRKAVEGRTPPCRGATQTRAVVTTAAFDFSSAGFAVVNIASRAFEYRAGALQRDAVIRAPGGIPIVVNRHGYNNLQILDIEDEDLPTINECSVRGGINSNPHDVLLTSASKGYVTPYGGSDLYVISPPILFEPELDPACNGFITDRIDLSSFDSDRVPQMDQMVTVGDDLFVALQLLDNTEILLPPRGNGVLAVIDTNTDTVKGSIALSFANPFAETKGLPWDEFQQRIFAGGPGNTTVLDDGGIEAVDPHTMQSAGLLMTGAELDANIFDFVIVGTGRAFAIIADESSNSVVDLRIGASPAERGIRKVLLSSTALITDIEMTERGELWVAYRGESGNDPSGLRIFRVTDNVELTVTTDPVPKPKPIALGQAPFTLAFIE